ncbi:hypothetical protein CYMTET_28628, partial [Cymbomonas tetramitiformis]
MGYNQRLHSNFVYRLAYIALIIPACEFAPYSDALADTRQLLQLRDLSKDQGIFYGLQGTIPIAHYSFLDAGPPSEVVDAPNVPSSSIHTNAHALLHGNRAPAGGHTLYGLGFLEDSIPYSAPFSLPSTPEIPSSESTFESVTQTSASSDSPEESSSESFYGSAVFYGLKSELATHSAPLAPLLPRPLLPLHSPVPPKPPPPAPPSSPSFPVLYPPKEPAAANSEPVPPQLSAFPPSPNPPPPEPGAPSPPTPPSPPTAPEELADADALCSSTAPWLVEKQLTTLTVAWDIASSDAVFGPVEGCSSTAAFEFALRMASAQAPANWTVVYTGPKVSHTIGNLVSNASFLFKVETWLRGATERGLVEGPEAAHSTLSGGGESGETWEVATAGLDHTSRSRAGVRAYGGGVAVYPGSLARSLTVSVVGAGNFTLPAPLKNTSFSSASAGIRGELVGPEYSFTPHGTEFVKPVQLELSYNVSIAEGMELTVLRKVDDVDSTWEDMSPLAGLKFEDGVATLWTDTFSVYSV